MKKVHFPLTSSKPLPGDVEFAAKDTLRRYEGLFKNDPDIAGYTLAARDGDPYIQVFVKQGRARFVEGRIPDRLDDLDVYYLETSVRALGSGVAPR